MPISSVFIGAGTRHTSAASRLLLVRYPSLTSNTEHQQHFQHCSTAKMERKPQFEYPYQHRGSRSSVSSHGNRNNDRTANSRLTSSSNATIQSSVTPSASNLRSPLHMQVQVESLPDGTSINSCSETYDEVNDNDDTLNETVMAVDLSPCGRGGCCYYVARDEKMYFMEDIQCSDVDVVESCKCC